MKLKEINLWTSLWIISALFMSVPVLGAPKTKPKLVLTIVIDQFRADYLTRFEHLYLPARQKNGSYGGFRYLMQNGAYFKNARHDHALAVTGLGHAVIHSGAYPYTHGIVSHRWYDFEHNDKMYCVRDKNALLVGTDNTNPDDGRSPKNLLVTTLGDEMKNAWGGKPLVAAVSLKDRSAILLAGHRADLAIWYDERANGFVSSTYYRKDKKLPEWLVAWNSKNYLKQKAPKIWNKLLPESEYWLSTHLDSETVAWTSGLTPQFPHPLNNPKAVLYSPWSNAYTLDTALELIKQMKFGADDVADLLGVSLSTFDMLGHNFGFMAAEMQDTAIRLDRQLADFFNALEKQIPGGLKNVALVLTGDHGVPINPAVAQKYNMPGGAYWPKKTLDDGSQFLRQHLNLGKDDPIILNVEETNIALNHTLLEKKNIALIDASRALAEWLRHQPFVATAYAKEDLLAGRFASLEVAKKLAHGVHPRRSGDVVFAPRPGFMELPDGKNQGAEHEASYPQDTTVPLIFSGPWFVRGVHLEEIKMNDLAPSIAAVLGIIAPSGSEGKVLATAIVP